MRKGCGTGAKIVTDPAVGEGAHTVSLGVTRTSLVGEKDQSEVGRQGREGVN